LSVVPEATLSGIEVSGSVAAMGATYHRESYAYAKSNKNARL